MSYQDIVPYTSVFIDANWKHFIRAALLCTISAPDRDATISDIQKLWTTDANKNHVLPCLSVRTGLDLYLSVMNYPKKTEVIVSAVNIPAMIQVLHAHSLKVVSLDIDIETMAPKLQFLESLINSNTKLLLLANVFGKGFDTEPYIQLAKRHNLAVIEDWAEGFSGFDYVGHPDADLALFSFGPIKYYTAFGGAVAKIRDEKVFQEMHKMYESYPLQSHAEYLTKVLKYSFVYMFLNCPRVVKPAMFITRTLGIDHKYYAISMLRGFPDKLIQRLRHRPSTALLAMMKARMCNFDPAEISVSNLKAEYVRERLPESVTQVGSEASTRNHWLFPVIVENPEEVVEALGRLGVDAYRGATQLSIVEPDNGDSHMSSLATFATRYPHEAKYLIEHVLYLPVNKLVPFHELDRICRALVTAVAMSDNKSHMTVHPELKLQSKL